MENKALTICASSSQIQIFPFGWKVLMKMVCGTTIVPGTFLNLCNRNAPPKRALKYPSRVHSDCANTFNLHISTAFTILQSWKIILHSYSTIHSSVDAEFAATNWLKRFPAHTCWQSGSFRWWCICGIAPPIFHNSRFIWHCQSSASQVGQWLCNSGIFG